MKWKKSVLVESTLILQDKWDDAKIYDSIVKICGEFIGNLINLFISAIWLVYAFVFLLLLQFIEAPIRMLVFRGKLKDKILYWLKTWKQAYIVILGV